MVKTFRLMVVLVASIALGAVSMTAANADPGQGAAGSSVAQLAGLPIGSPPITPNGREWCC